MIINYNRAIQDRPCHHGVASTRICYKCYIYSKTNHVINKQCEYGVHVTNSYIHAKCERVLLDIHRDIHHFINVLFVSR